MNRLVFIVFIFISNISYSQFIDYVEHSNNKKFKYHEKNCVQYLHSLLVGYDKSLISDTKFKQEVFITKDVKDYSKESGVCEALVKRGKANYTKKPVRGDIFQFWIIMNGWKPSGHCGVIKEVLGNNKYLIISSYNESGCNGYCESVMDIKDMQISYIWFVHLI